MGSVFKDVGRLAGQLVGGLTTGISETDPGTPFTGSLDPAILKQQQEFAQALLAQSQGLGPSLGQAQLKQASGEAQQKAAALAASQRGISPGLAQRQALMAQANLQQQAAAESAKVAAQQQLAAQDMYQRQLAQLQQQRMGLESMKYQQELGEQQQRRGVAGALISGGAQAGAAALGSKKAAHGGMIQREGYAGGGMIPNGSLSVAAHIIGEDGYETPEMQLAYGAMIPGQAEVDGDSYQNDKVPVMLSPGEIVIPRSVALSPNAPEKSKKFVQKTLLESPVAKTQMQDGGQVPMYLDPSQNLATPQLSPSQIIGVPQVSAAPLTPEQQQKVAEYDEVNREREQLRMVSPYGFIQKGVELIPAPREGYEKQLSEVARQSLQEKKFPELKVEDIEGGDGKRLPVEDIELKKQIQPIGPALPSGVGFMDAYNKQISGLGAEVSAMGQLAKQKADALQTYNKAIMEREKQYNQNIASLQSQIAKTNQELTDVDPGRYYGNLSTPAKIGQALAIMGGAIGAQLQGSNRNMALEIVNENINRDIAAQRENLNTKRTLLSGYYQQMGDLKSAETMARATMQDQVLNEMKAMELKATEPIKRAQIQQQIAALQQERNKNLAVLAAKQTIQQASTGALKQSPEQTLAMAEATDPKLAEDLRKRLVPGIGFAQREVPNKVLDDVASRKEMDTKLRGLYDFASKNAGSLDPEVRSRGAAMAQDAFLAIKRAETLGTLDKGSVEFIERLIENPAGFTAQLFAQPKFKVLIESNNRSLNNMLKSYGVKTPKDISTLESKVGR